MTISIDASEIHTTQDLLARVLIEGQHGERVQFLVPAGNGPLVVQRMRVALSRSRSRHRAQNRKINEFTLMSEIYPYTLDGRRHDCVVMWTLKTIHHRKRELLDDLVERIQP